MSAKLFIGVGLVSIFTLCSLKF